MELNREQIKKALECCHTKGKDCLDCPYENDHSRCIYLEKNALALLNELTEENERLRERNIALEQKLIILGCDEQYVFKATVQKERTAIIPRSKVDDIYTSGMMDGVRQMQERLKQVFYSDNNLAACICSIIDQIAKEMLEGTNEEG